MTVINRVNIDGRNSIENLFLPLNDITPSIRLPCQLKGLFSFFKIFFFLLRKVKDRKIHITGDVHYVSFLLFWKKSILTIHDLYFYEQSKGWRKKIYGFVWFWLPLRTSNIITVISPNTKKSLVKNFKINPHKIRLIDNYTVSIKKFQREKHNHFNILAIGTRENKNVERLIEAVGDFEIESIRLIIIGKLHKVLEEMLVQRNIVYESYFNLSHDILSQKYCNADLLYFASLREGFGLPILEAQSVGLPVITSNLEPMKYVAGDAAILVDPFDVGEIKDKIHELMEKKQLRDELIIKGYVNIKRFTKEKFISSYLHLYKNL